MTSGDLPINIASSTVFCVSSDVALRKRCGNIVFFFRKQEMGRRLICDLSTRLGNSDLQWVFKHGKHYSKSWYPLTGRFSDTVPIPLPLEFRCAFIVVLTLV